MIGQQFETGALLFFSSKELHARGLSPTELSAQQALALLHELAEPTQDSAQDLGELRLFHSTEGILLSFRRRTASSPQSVGSLFC